MIIDVLYSACIIYIYMFMHSCIKCLEPCHVMGIVLYRT